MYVRKIISLVLTFMLFISCVNYKVTASTLNINENKLKNQIVLNNNIKETFNINASEPKLSFGEKVMVFVLTAIMGSIIDNMTTDLYSEAKEFLTKYYDLFGGIFDWWFKARQSYNFNYNLKENWVGVGQANKTERVKDVQKALKDLGYYNSSIDGICGNGTINAIKNFQKYNNLSPDSICGTNTWKTLLKHK